MSKKEAKKSRRCMVCGKEVSKNKWIGVNAAVTGEYLSLGGHSTCVHNVNDLVVIPNRLRIYKRTILTDWEQVERDNDLLQAFVYPPRGSKCVKGIYLRGSVDEDRYFEEIKKQSKENTGK